MNDYARDALETLAYVESLMTQLDRSNPAGYIASAPRLARIDPVLLPSESVPRVRLPRQSVGAIRLGAPYH